MYIKIIVRKHGNVYLFMFSTEQLSQNIVEQKLSVILMCCRLALEWGITFTNPHRSTSMGKIMNCIYDIDIRRIALIQWANYYVQLLYSVRSSPFAILSCTAEAHYAHSIEISTYQKYFHVDTSLFLFFTILLHIGAHEYFAYEASSERSRRDGESDMIRK